MQGWNASAFTSKAEIQLLCKLFLQYSAEGTKVHPVLTSPAVNDVVERRIGLVHVLLYSSFYLAILHFQRCTQPRRWWQPRKKTSQQVLFMDFHCLFLTQLWALWPPVNLFRALNRWHAPGVVVCSPSGDELRCRGCDWTRRWQTIHDRPFSVLVTTHYTSLTTDGSCCWQLQLSVT